MSYRLHIPTTLDQALKIRRRTDGTYLAAGTVILVNHRHSGDLISLEKIEGLTSIEEDSESIEFKTSEIKSVKEAYSEQESA